MNIIKLMKRNKVQNMFKLKMYDDNGKEIASVKSKKPKDLKDAFEEWWLKIR